MNNASVRRRHVFFLAGFDPKGAAYYHRLYARQAALQGALTGQEYEVGPRSRCADGNSAWTVRHAMQGLAVETTYEYARWDDVVRANWPQRAWQVAGDALATYWTMLCSGRLGRVRKAAPRTLVPLVFPALFWLAMLLAALACGAALACLLPARVGVSAPVGVLAAAGVLRLALAWERRLHTSWLLRIYRFAHLRSVDRVAGLDQRVDGLAAALDAHLRDPSVQEVLLVGFSVGSLLAVSAAARARGQDGPAAGKLALLTLGHCVPMLGLMPKAERFRAELARLAHAEGVTWLDFSSPTDWGSFALVDPVGLCLGEAAAPPGRRRFASPRFHCLFSPAAYRRLRRNKRRMHLQYLMAGERAGDYDYFALTAGPLSLRARYDQGCAG